MKLQTATRLGLYAVLELARDPERTLSASDLSERFGVSAHHMAKVLRTLANAGLVKGGRGAAGGYRFTGNRRRTTLMDIVALFEPAPGSRPASHSTWKPLQMPMTRPPCAAWSTTASIIGEKRAMAPQRR